MLRTASASGLPGVPKPKSQQDPTSNVQSAHPVCVAQQAYSPLGDGKLATDADLTTIGKTYGKSAAQVLQQPTLMGRAGPLPRFVRVVRLSYNIHLSDNMRLSRRARTGPP